MLSSPAGSSKWAVRIQGHIAEIEWFKAPEVDDFNQAANALIGHKDYRRGLALLVIDRGTEFNPTKEGIEQIVTLLAAHTQHFDRHIAIAVEKESHFGLVRLFAARAEKHGLVLMPFRQVDEARMWLMAHFSDSQTVAVPAE